MGALPTTISIIPHPTGSNHRAPCLLQVWIRTFEHEVTYGGSAGSSR